MNKLLAALIVLAVIYLILSVGGAAITRNVADTAQARAAQERAIQAGETARVQAIQQGQTERAQSFNLTLAAIVAMTAGSNSTVFGVVLGAALFAAALVGNRRGWFDEPAKG